jgi:hypothetical protein
MSIFSKPALLVQSSKLLLTPASTVVLGFGPRRDPWPIFYIFFKTVFAFEMGSPLQRGERLVFLSRRHICCTVISHECTRTHKRPGKDICTLWTPYALCQFTKLNNMHDKHRTSVNALYQSGGCHCYSVFSNQQWSAEKQSILFSRQRSHGQSCVRKYVQCLC